jgi:hypothetical protein
MGDDVNIIVPPEPEPTIEDDTYERAGEELVTLLTAQAERLGEALARITELEGRIASLEGRQWAEVEHSHEGFALAGHTHDDEYALAEHSHETTKEREPDKPPEKQHPYFRRLDEF